MTEITRRDFLKLTHTMLRYAILCYAQPLLGTLCAPTIVWHGKRHTPLIALTFDDCYNFNSLLQLESILDDNPQIKVTFFPVGVALLNTFSKDPHLWQRLVSKGHEIGYHSHTHAMPSTLSTKQMIADFEKWCDACLKVLGKTPEVKFARPPYGERSPSFLNLCCERNLIAVMWSADWGGAYETVRRKIARVQKGDIVLLHIRRQDIENTRNALPLIREMPLRAVTLSELFFGAHEADEEGKEMLGAQ